MALKNAISQVINRQDLTREEAREAMDNIMNGDATAAQIGSYLTALRMKGETVDEIVGSAESMRSHVVSVALPEAVLEETLLDTCGTGGDGKHTFNISTTTAFVVAGHGIRVAKHGNRAASSKSGSADVLLALGGNLDLTGDQVAQCITDVGIGFLYAINHHPAMRYAIGPRREIAQRTIFNVLGPLTNPAGASHQLIGVYDPSLTEPMAHVLSALGSKAAFVAHGADGLDELSTTGVNRVSALRNGQVSTFDLDPAQLGLKPASVSDMVGGTPEENAQITRRILAGEDQGPRRDIVLLNAAAAICLVLDDWPGSLKKASAAIDSGAALKALENWIEKTRSFTHERE